MEPAQARRWPERSAQYQNLLRMAGDYRPDSSGDGPVLQATRMRSIVNCHRLAQAYKEGSKVAYVSDQFPTEIVFPFDIIPWNIESMAIMLSQTMDVNRVFQLTQERELSRDVCSFLRGPCGMILADCYPTPDLVLTNDQPCEGLSKMMFHSSRHFRAPLYGLHSPSSIDEESLSYLERQLDRMMGQIARELGRELDVEAFRASIRRSNEARAYYRKTLDLLKRFPLPGVSRELQEIFGMNYFGSQENARLCQALYENARDLAERSIGTTKRRVLWIGQVPEESHELLRHLRQVVDIVFWAPFWEGNTQVIDEDRPLRSIAERAMRFHWSSERMGMELERLCDECAIQGALFVSVWGCRNMMGLTPVFREIARARNLKSLTINTDFVDRNNYAHNHVKNRVDAFLELVQ